MDKKVLIISNTALRRDNSNGKTLLTYLSNFKQENIYSFYIQNTFPDYNVCNSSFRLTDKDKISGFIYNKKHNGFVIENKDLENKENNNTNVSTRANVKENSFALLMRELIWSIGCWKKDKLYSWIEKSKPDVLLYMCGRSSFMNKIALKVSLKFNIPLIVYASEDEYFHKYPFYRVFKNILQIKLRKSYKKLFDNVKKVICMHDELEYLYKKEFGVSCVTIYPSTSFGISNQSIFNKDADYVYAGNLQPNRYFSLINFSKALKEVEPNMKINIYCKDLDKKVIKSLSLYENIVIKKPVSPLELEEIYKNSYCILHFESFRKRDKVLIKNSFTGKIVDCLGSGVPLLAYVPDYTAISKYLRKINYPFVINEQASLINVLKNNINNSKYREDIFNIAYNITQQNHIADKNSSKFIEELFK